MQISEPVENIQSPEKLASMMAPQDENALRMHRMKDTSLRPRWRLTKGLFEVGNGALPHKKKMKSPLDELFRTKGLKKCSGWVNENKRVIVLPG